MGSATPLVTVIMAAYNRSNIISYSIGSVLNQVFVDFELIVVDDASTDDTVEVVRAIHDDRIKLVVLAKNSGSQSEPNNVGLSHARGRYIAYLNQDDLWFPDHLEKMVQNMEQHQADWVFSYAINILPDNILTIRGVFPDDAFKTFYGTGLTGSTWLVRKVVLDKLGGWSSPFKLRIPPSQDLLFRAVEAGTIIRNTPCVTVIYLPSSVLRNSYDRHVGSDHQHYYEQVNSNPLFREELCMKALVSARKCEIRDSLLIHKGLRKILMAVLLNVSRITGIPSLKIYNFLTYPQKGSYIKYLRKTRGLNPTP
jgi:glycosyltransferase involved in cell wall biosynthesis